MQLCQLEFHSEDVASSLRFMEAVLGWRAVPITIQDQTVLEVPGNSPYGISVRLAERRNRQDESRNNHPLVAYFEVTQSLALLREQCKAEGAIICQEPTPVTGYGLVMVIEEPGGLKFGFYEPRLEGPRGMDPASPQA